MLVGALALFHLGGAFFLPPEFAWGRKLRLMQVHRGTVVNVKVNVNAVRGVLRGVSSKLALLLKQRPEKLEVSATYAHRFKQLRLCACCADARSPAARCRVCSCR